MQTSIIWAGATSLIVGAVLILLGQSADLDPLDAVPVDAGLVVVTDLLDVRAEATSERVQAAFDGELPGFDLIDGLAGDAAGVSVIDDVLPWTAGPTVAWATPIDAAGCVISEVADRGGARDFVEALRNDERVTNETERAVDGGTAYVLSLDGPRVTVAQLGGGVYLCTGDGLDDSVAALSGESILDAEDAAASLTADALLIAWVDLPELLGGDAGLFGTGLSLDPDRLAPLTLVYEVDDVGIRWGITTDADLLEEVIDDSFVESLPEDTALGVLGAIPDLGIPFDQLAGAAPDLAGVVGLLSLLDGPLALGVTDSGDALLGQLLGAPIDFVLSVGTEDPDALADALLGLVAGQLEVPIGGLEEEPTDDGTLYSFAVPFLGELAAISTTQDALTISGSREGALGEGPRLSGTEAWADAISALGDDASVMLWLDPGRIANLDLGLLLEGLSGFADLGGGEVDVPGPDVDMDLSALTSAFDHEAIEAVVAGGSSDGETTSMDVVILVDW